MVYCFLGNGFEEIEAIAPIDILKRAGIAVTTVGIGDRVITGSHGISVTADITDSEFCTDESLEAIILPGGMPGFINLDGSLTVHRAIDFANEKQKLICAICAAPSILGKKGLLDSREAIAFPGFEKDLKGAVISKKSVVRDGNIITAKGAGVAVKFGFEIAAALAGRKKSDEIFEQIQCE